MDPVFLLTIVAVMGLAGTLTIAVYRTVARPVANEEFDDVLARITGTELDEDTALARSSKRARELSWSGFWLTKVRKAGREVQDESTPGRVMIGIAVVGAFFGAVVYPGGYKGVYLGVMALLVVWLWLNFEEGKRRFALEKQMPLLLSGLRTQMHAGVTVQGALLAVVDGMPKPMGQELQIVRDDITVGVPLDDALRSLGNRMHSRLMQFLVASIGVALRSGSDLVPQLVTIEEIVQQRARIQGKVRAAIALAKPTSYMAIAAPPAMAGWMMVSDPDYLRYFLGPGMLVGLVGVIMYVSGAVLLKFMVSGVEKV